MGTGKCRARIVCRNDRGRRRQAGQAVTRWHGPLKRLAGREAVIKTGTSRGAVVGNTVSLYVEQGPETVHTIHVEARSSFSLALRISLLAAALLAALVWILRLLVKRLILVLV